MVSSSKSNIVAEHGVKQLIGGVGAGAGQLGAQRNGAGPGLNEKGVFGIGVVVLAVGSANAGDFGADFFSECEGGGAGVHGAFDLDSLRMHHPGCGVNNLFLQRRCMHQMAHGCHPLDVMH